MIYLKELNSPISHPITTNTLSSAISTTLYITTTTPTNFSKNLYLVLLQLGRYKVNKYHTK